MDHATQTHPGTQTPGGPPGLAGPPDLTGRTLADFRVLRRLGAGGMGEVYLAEQVSLKRHVALKVLRTELLAADPRAKERFLAEAHAAARATHANIVQVYAVGEAEGVCYMALEYVEGRNLRDYLARKGPPEVLPALGVMRQVAAALVRAGELGIVHRDIKPENILLTRKGEVKVADFGLSRCLTGDQPLHLTQSGVTLGTPLYMSPEQVEGKPLDPRTDIYSFGITCYHMLAGQPPFRGESAFEVALQHVRAEPPPLSGCRPDLPEALCALVHKMMAKDPAQRPQTARDLLRDIARVRESLGGATGAVRPLDISVDLVPVTAQAVAAPATAGRGPQEPETSAPSPAPRNPSGRPLLVAASLAGALLLGVACGWLRRHAAAPAHAAAVLPAEGEVYSPQEREQTLRKAADEYLEAPRKTPDEIATGLGLSLKLALLYLDLHRLDDAEQLFDRLDRIHQPRQYHVLGHLGRGVVLALRSQPKESNKLFQDVFTPWPAREAARKKADGLPAWQNPLWQNPQLRAWLARAVDYNHQNGLDDSDLPLALRPLRAHP
jgi:serine/threonine-protein kinase